MRISDWSSDVCSSDLKGRDRDDLLNEFRRGEIPILLLSPEIALGAARDVLLEAATPAGAKYASLKANLRTLVIDEAHIVESWGRSFRPDFQRLPALRSEEHTSELQSLMRISYAVFCLKKKKRKQYKYITH